MAYDGDENQALAADARLHALRVATYWCTRLSDSLKTGQISRRDAARVLDCDESSVDSRIDVLTLRYYELVALIVLLIDDPPGLDLISESTTRLGRQPAPQPPPGQLAVSASPGASSSKFPKQPLPQEIDAAVVHATRSVGLCVDDPRLSSRQQYDLRVLSQALSAPTSEGKP